MNHWLKRIAILAPPVIIAGVYFQVIPVGTGVRTKIDNMMGKKKSAEAVIRTTPPMIEKVAGEVYMRERPGLELIAVRGSELLKKGASLATGDGSFALLTSRGVTNWVLKVGPNSEINIDDTGRFNLIRGGLMSVVKKTPVSVRTKFANFVTQGTTFAVLTDGETKAILTVKEGVIEAENFGTTDKNPVRDAHNYLVNREGEKKIVLDLDAVDLFTWNAEDLTTEFPTMEAVVQKTGDLGPTPDDQERARQAFLNDIDKAIRDFRTKNEELARELSILRENADQSREGLRAEIRSVEKDIRCIETSPSECNLMNDKILLKRGYPRLWGNAKYRHSMVVELQKYLQERDVEVDGREEEAQVLEKLMKARTEILKLVESDRQNEANLETLIPKLQDTRLRR